MSQSRSKFFKFETRAIHTGQVPEDGTGSVTTPIFPSSTFRVGYPGNESGYVYSRWSNPTRGSGRRSAFRSRTQHFPASKR